MFNYHIKVFFYSPHPDGPCGGNLPRLNLTVRSLCNVKLSLSQYRLVCVTAAVRALPAFVCPARTSPAPSLPLFSWSTYLSSWAPSWGLLLDLVTFIVISTKSDAIWCFLKNCFCNMYLQATYFILQIPQWSFFTKHAPSSPSYLWYWQCMEFFSPPKLTGMFSLFSSLLFFRHVSQDEE